MSWELLPVNYTDAVWSGLKKYNQINNQDGTVSFQDVTAYSHRENSFFGALQANRMNEALNTLMSMVENGTDLYGAFQNYFNTQKGLFENAADTAQIGFEEYVASLKTQGDDAIEEIETDYRAEINRFKTQQEALLSVWFESVSEQIDANIAGHLQTQINALDVKTDGFDACETVFSADGTITETCGAKQIQTVFVSENVIRQILRVNGILAITKIITFNADGSISEEVQ